MSSPARYEALACDDPDIRFWTPETAALTPLSAPPSLNVLDLRGTRPDERPIPAAADLVVVDSGSCWTALAATALCIAVPAIADPAPTPSDLFTTMLLALDDQPTAEALYLASSAVAWAEANDIACGLLGPTGPAGLARLTRFGTAGTGPAAAVLDLRERDDILSLPLLDAMAAGAPVLFYLPTPFRDDLERCGAGVALQTGLPDFAALSPERRRDLSAASLAYVRDRHSRAAAWIALQRGINAARHRLSFRMAHWTTRTSAIFVLVLSDEALNLLDIRVHLPFAALHARGAIAGYAVLRHGEFVFSTETITPATRFGAIWVQRSLDPLVELLLQVLERPFVYDLDDLLLVSPSYREAFPAQSADTARSLIGKASVLSSATSRLATLAQHHGAPGAIAKTVVTPNLASFPARTSLGPPRKLVWASSDAPALSSSRHEVALAVRDFCLAHRLDVLCVGAPPPPLFAAAGLTVEHAGLMSYAAYLDRLRTAAPGILLGPLETKAAQPTQDFVDAKSDIKVIEARMAGLVGVFSRAAPYLDSDLAPDILCDNTYQSWLDGLERARLQSLRETPSTPFPAHRSTEENGLMPWVEALSRARTDLSADDVAAAVRFVRAQGETLISAPALFDEDDYLRRHRDVREAVAAGVVPSGYRHYVQSGFREGREARRLQTPDTAAAFWWSRLLHQVNRLETSIGERTRTIERLRDRTALRHALPSPPPPPVPTGAIDWTPAGSLATICPVCDSPGPHPKRLVFMGETLLRCPACRTAFYERREIYDYEDSAASSLLLQLNLEQNAGIYHQTRPLFALDDVRSVLDVGCGFGFSVDLAASLLGWRAVGIDPSFYAAAGRTELGADLRQEYLSPESDLGGSFDLVLASEVLEHLPEPHDFLALLRRHLAPGGTLVLSTPDADAIAPEIGPSRLLAILAPRVHLVLFTRDSLARALQRAGFKHVQVTRSGDGLLAYAADRPIRFRADAEPRHNEAYQHYLETLLDRAPPGSPLWNGAAGRLLSWRTPAADDATLNALFTRITKAWRTKFDFDPAKPRLPDLPQRATAAALGKIHPFNLAPVLLARATLVARTAGRSPTAILAYARPAYRIALQTGRALQHANMIDHDLRATAQRARMLVLDALAELAPEMEASLLAGLLQPSPGALAEWADPALDALTPRLAIAFAAAVAADRFDEARRLEPALRDIGELCRRLDASDETLLRTLFALGVQRLVADADPAAAFPAFQRMHDEARRRLHRGPVIADLLHLAEEHMTIATHQISHPTSKA